MHSSFFIAIDFEIWVYKEIKIHFLLETLGVGLDDSISYYYDSSGTLNTNSQNLNLKLLQQLKSGFKSTINWNKYHSKTTPQNAPNPYFNVLIDPSFLGVNRLFVLPFNANDGRIGHSRYHLPTAKVKDYNVMINGKKPI